MSDIRETHPLAWEVAVTGCELLLTGKDELDYGAALDAVKGLLPEDRPLIDPVLILESVAMMNLAEHAGNEHYERPPDRGITREDTAAGEFWCKAHAIADSLSAKIDPSSGLPE